MRSVDQHRAVVAALLPRRPVVELDLERAEGLVIGRDVAAPLDLPPFDNSAMDGYALRTADVAVLPATLPVAQDIPAGKRDVAPLPAGAAARIMTGAPIPAGAEIIVPVEQTDGGVDRVRIDAVPARGVFIRRRGEDVTRGAIVLAAGTVVTAPVIGVAAALGLATLPVYQPIRVLLLSTGSELADPATELAPGQIHDSNSPMLAAALRRIGAQPTVARVVADDVATFRRTLDDQAAGADLIVTSGGVSAGAYEVVKQALTDDGVEFVKVAMQPGMPQGAGRFGATPIVTLPGNPVSSWLSFEVFLRPAIRAAMGHAEIDRPAVRLPLTAAVESPAGKRQFRRGVVDAVAGTVAPWGGPGSHLLAQLAGADALIVVGEDVTAMAAGEVAEVWLLD